MLDAMHINNAGRLLIWKDLLQNQSQRSLNILCRTIRGPALPDLWFSQQVSLTCITWCYSFWLQYWELILPLYLSECVCICVQVCVCMRVFCDRDSVSSGWPQTCYVAQYDLPYKYGVTIAGLRWNLLCHDLVLNTIDSQYPHPLIPCLSRISSIGLVNYFCGHIE